MGRKFHVYPAPKINASGFSAPVVLHSKQDKSVRSKQDSIWSSAMKEENGPLVLDRRASEDGMIAIGMEAAHDS